MVLAKQLVSDIFHGSASYADLVRNFRELCSGRLGYEFVGNLEDIYQIFFFNYTMTLSDYSTSEEKFLYAKAKDCRYFKKPTILGLRKEGLVIETDLDGWTRHDGRYLHFEKLRINNFKIHGYGKVWDVSQTNSQLKDRIRDELSIPRSYELRLLTEDYMRKAVENLA